MKTLMTAITLLVICAAGYTQDTDVPITIPGDRICIHQIVLPNVIIQLDSSIANYTLISHPTTGAPLFVPSGNGRGGSGPVTKPPPCGYKFTTDDPGRSGCEYVTVNGKLANGDDFSITAQVYVYQGTSTTDKAKDISDEFNKQSDNHGSDPIVSSAAQGSLIVQPAAGCKVTSQEWSNGSAEEDNEAEELDGIESQSLNNCKNSIIYRINASTTRGTPAGIKCDRSGVSSISIGCGPYKIITFVQSTDTNLAILQRLQDGLNFLLLTNKIGVDEENNHWIVWENPYKRARFGTNDLGLTNILVTDKSTPSIIGKQTVKVGNYIITLW